MGSVAFRRGEVRMIAVKTLEDVINLIEARIEEGPTLEYKRELGKNEDIAKEVSAFANTQGGIVIYGVASKDRVPICVSWIEGENLEERIQNVIATSIQPRLAGVNVVPCPNPDNENQAAFIVDVPRSPAAPHMSGYRYYKRQGSISVPMNDDEVKNAMFGPGRNAALRFEISANLDLAKRTDDLIDRVTVVVPPERRKPIAVVPLHTDAWNALVASGLLFTFPDELASQLVEAYAMIYEINSLIDWLKVGKEMIVHTSAYEDSFKEHGTYIPFVIRQRIRDLRTHLDQIGNRLQEMGEAKV